MTKKSIGFSVLNGDARSLARKTVLVLGVGRGGTSMVAGVLAKLGVYMGEGLNSRYQDSAILDCINRNDKGEAKKIIRERNDKYAIWGVKKLNLWRWDRLFREPVYVVIFRDVLATANRRVTLFNGELLLEMAKVLGLNCLLLVFLSLSKRPVFVASYEKAVLYPEEFVQGLSAFLGLDSHERQSEAVKFVRPSPTEYITSPVNYRAVRESRVYLGYVDQLEATQITGWALSTLNEEPVRLELLINGISRQTLVADLSRPDVPKEDARWHEHCGFVFRLPEGQALARGDNIDIRIVDQDMSLINSPQRFG